MKLKDAFVTQQIEDTQFLIAVGGEAFSGVVRSNKTAAYIVDLLGSEITREEIVDAMCRKYDAPREVIAADVDGVLEKLRSIHALEE